MDDLPLMLGKASHLARIDWYRPQLLLSITIRQAVTPRGPLLPGALWKKFSMFPGQDETNAQSPIVTSMPTWTECWRTNIELSEKDRGRNR
jgi:hypothetical protein